MIQNTKRCFDKFSQYKTSKVGFRKSAKIFVTMTRKNY